MRVILFGATGMIGQGVLRECLLDPEVERVLAVGRRKTGSQHEKLREVVHQDFSNFSAIESQLSGFDACFFCLGVSSAGMSEADYRRVTYDFTMAAAETLVKRNPGMTFLYVSGAGTDSTERGRAMWARVKGATENALLRLPFKAAYMFRPAYIQPLHGITSSTKWTRALYAVMGPLYPVWKRLFPNYVTTTDELGRAMILAAKRGASKRVLESRDLAEGVRGGTA
ncbi:MAG: NAD(P)H-binding protein [Vicinamibacteria bacterium]